MVQRYEVDYNEDFIEYLKQMVLPISFIDESVELSRMDTPNDLVGKAYLPLRDLLTENMKQYKLQIKNLKQETAGMVEI